MKFLPQIAVDHSRESLQSPSKAPLRSCCHRFSTYKTPLSAFLFTSQPMLLLPLYYIAFRFFFVLFLVGFTGQHCTVALCRAAESPTRRDPAVRRCSASAATAAKHWWHLCPVTISSSIVYFSDIEPTEHPLTRPVQPEAAQQPNSPASQTPWAAEPFFRHHRHCFSEWQEFFQYRPITSELLQSLSHTYINK